jgi:formylglycine-generating enzyme required for sulfatase activity
MKQFVSCCVVAVFAVMVLHRVAFSQAPIPKDGPLGMEFVPLSKGTTYLGWNGRKGSAKETEINEAFEIAIHTVTQGQWQELMGNNPSWFSRDGQGREKVQDITDEDLKQFPVENVSWDDCQEFLRKLNENEKGKGYVYRLPTEWEWEYACRGGATTEEQCSYHFYFAKPTNDLSSKEANFNGGYPYGKGEKGPALGRPTKVGSYEPNALGLYDVHGNVWQWCNTSVERKLTAEVQTFWILRGGSWYDTASYIQAADRVSMQPTSRSKIFGLRLVRVPSKPVDK